MFGVYLLMGDTLWVSDENFHHLFGLVYLTVFHYLYGFSNTKID